MDLTVGEIKLILEHVPDDAIIRIITSGDSCLPVTQTDYNPASNKFYFITRKVTNQKKG